MKGKLFMVLLLLGVCFLYGITVAVRYGHKDQQTSLSEQLTSLEDDCTEASLPSRQACLKIFYGNDATKNGVDHALALIDAQIKHEPQFGGTCHAIMHQIGHAAAHEFGALGEAFVHGDDECQNGYYHGVIEEFLRNEDPDSVTASDLRDFCSGASSVSSSSYAELNCTHGLGHALVYMTGDDLPRSLLRCGDLVGDVAKSQCATGAFMQHTFNMANDHLTSEAIRNDPSSHCAQGAGIQDGCWITLSARTISNGGKDLDHAQQFCDTIVNPTYRTDCLQGLSK